MVSVHFPFCRISELNKSHPSILGVFPYKNPRVVVVSSKKIIPSTINKIAGFLIFKKNNTSLVSLQQKKMVGGCLFRPSPPKKSNHPSSTINKSWGLWEDGADLVNKGECCSLTNFGTPGYNTAWEAQIWRWRKLWNKLVVFLPKIWKDQKTIKHWKILYKSAFWVLYQ